MENLGGMHTRSLLFAFLFCISLSFAGLSAESRAGFVNISLGTSGGLREDNLTCFLLAKKGSSDYIALDAGTLLAGIRRANALGSFYDLPASPNSDLTTEGLVLTKHIGAYLISHPHLDHLMGMVINSTDDAAKPILGTSATIDVIKQHVFNWKLWPNFAKEGVGFALGKYEYLPLSPGQMRAVPGTPFRVEAFALAHSSPYESTAFLLEAGGEYVLYFGDTGPDSVEKSDRMRAVWERAAPLLRDGKLRGLYLEVSYPDGRPDKLLFGHLTPAWLLKELRQLATLTKKKKSLEGLTVFVTHIKPSLKKSEAPESVVRRQLTEHNDLGVRFVLPRQGERTEF